VVTVLNEPRNVCCVERTWPWPRHVPQVSGFAPSLPPLPLQRVQVSSFVISTARSAPNAASSSVISRS
jgi:hypothetical protein